MGMGAFMEDGVILLIQPEKELSYFSFSVVSFFIHLLSSWLRTKKDKVWRNKQMAEGFSNCAVRFLYCNLKIILFSSCFVQVSCFRSSGDFLKKIFYFFLERGEVKEKERESNIDVWLLLTCPFLGTWPSTQACALTGNWTGDSLVCRPALNPLSYTSQGRRFYYHDVLFLFLNWVKFSPMRENFFVHLNKYSAFS